MREKLTAFWLLTTILISALLHLVLRYFREQVKRDTVRIVDDLMHQRDERLVARFFRELHPGSEEGEDA